MNLDKASMLRLNDCNPILSLVLIEAGRIVPFKVIQTFRDQVSQDKAFAEGKTKLKWPHGKHNKRPSDAADLAPLYFDEGSSIAKIDWGDYIAFGRIMGVVQAVAHGMKVKLRFGLDWDGDFRSVGRDPNETFLDAPHVEVIL